MKERNRCQVRVSHKGVQLHSKKCVKTVNTVTVNTIAITTINIVWLSIDHLILLHALIPISVFAHQCSHDVTRCTLLKGPRLGTMGPPIP